MSGLPLRWAARRPGPGVAHAPYRAFRNYRIGNQILAAMQLTSRGLPLTPIASFNAWKEKGHSVKKGQKAIQLFMPVSLKRQEKNDTTDVHAGEGRRRFLEDAHEGNQMVALALELGNARHKARDVVRCRRCLLRFLWRQSLVGLERLHPGKPGAR